MSSSRLKASPDEEVKNSEAVAGHTGIPETDEALAQEESTAVRADVALTLGTTSQAASESEMELAAYQAKNMEDSERLPKITLPSRYDRVKRGEGGVEL